MSCLQLILICIVLQSSIAPIFGAPISDCKSRAHKIDDKEIKVTSHVSVGLAGDQKNPLDGRNPLKNHEIQIGDDASMHIKIDISISPEMLINGAEAGKASPTVNPEKNSSRDPLQKTPTYPVLSGDDGEVSEPLKEIEEDELSDPSNPSIKPDQQNPKDLDAKKDLLGGVTEKVADKSIDDKKLEKNPAGELDGALKSEPRSIGDRIRPTNDGENLKGESDSLAEDEDAEDMEDDQAMEEESEEDDAATVAVENSKDVKTDKVDAKPKDDGEQVEEEVAEEDAEDEVEDMGEDDEGEE